MSDAKPGHVDTPYGPMPGCVDCGVIVLSGGAHVCEHGVTPAPVLEASFSITVNLNSEQARAWGLRNA